MGSFIYGRREVGFQSYAIDDRTLKHLELAVAVKLRRREPFMFTLQNVEASAYGMHVLWVSAAVPLQFAYERSSRRIPINPSWVEALVRSACQPDGLHLVPEPVPSLGGKDSQ